MEQDLLLYAPPVTLINFLNGVNWIGLDWIRLDERIRQTIRLKVEHLEEFHFNRIAEGRSIGAIMIFADQQSSEGPVQLSANKENFLPAGAVRQNPNRETQRNL
jgi:hypothetical protein